MAETWNEATPAGTDNPKQADDRIRELKTAIRERLAEDHHLEATETVAFGESGSQIGHHKKAVLIEQASDPTTAENELALYCKDVAGQPELFCRPESNGTAVQLTQSGSVNPIGSMQMWAGSSGSPPGGWLICNGQAVSRSTYAELFTVIGTTFGVGDGSTTFNVPDLQDRLPIGVGSSIATALAATGGASTKDLSHVHATVNHALTVAELPEHVHTYVKPDNKVYMGSGAYEDVYNSAGTDTTGVGNGCDGDGHNHGDTESGGSATQDVMNPYIGIHFIIKY